MLRKYKSSEKLPYHYFYKITNKINGNFYYGVHNTDDVDDGYMGSGTRLKYAIKLFGIENFDKEIIKFFDTADEAFEFEATVVTEDLVNDPNCYNSTLGGSMCPTIGMATVVDKEGNQFIVPLDDPRYLSGELVGCTSGRILVKDRYGKRHFVSKNDPRYLSGAFVKCDLMKDGDDGKLPVRDSSGNIYYVKNTDPRYLSGELVAMFKGRTHTEEAKEKIRDAHRKNKYQSGTRNSHYGKIWIKNDKTMECLCIPKNDFDKYSIIGWTKGRNMKYKKRKRIGCVAQ